MVKNTPDAKRTYSGLTADVTFRMSSLQLGGNYTLSWSRGNVDGEDAGSGPIRATINTYPEYRQASWNSPVGYTFNDQRHKVRAWLSYHVPGIESLGALDVGVLQRFDSALPYDASGVVNPLAYVNNPGYLTPPSTVTYYFSARNGLRWHGLRSTDVAVNWSKKIPQLRTTQVFFRGVVANVLNRAAVVSGDSTILTAASPGSATGLQPFNPFTTQSVQGTNWIYGPNFGQPTGTGSYQPTRTFSCSVGVRF